MEWVGFLALLALGVYAVFAGVMMQIVTAGLSGKDSGAGLVILATGLGLIYLAWVNKPFAIVVA